MSDDKKTEKKIAKRREDILFWLKAAEKYANQYKQATDEKKRAKCGKSLQSAKESIQFAVNAVIDLGGSIDDIPETLSRERLEIWNEMFENADSDDIAIDKEIRRIKKLLNEDLKEAMEKYAYDPEEPIEEKRKNKLFYQEHAIGLTLKHSSRKTMASGTPNKAYNDCWNYDRDYETTKDKYFSKEEQDLIINCLRSHQEEAAYLSEKRAWMGRLGESLCKTAEKIGEWGDITSARVLAQGLSKEIFQQTVTEIEGKLPKDELKKRADEMTRRYIRFISDPQELEEAMIQEKESEIEAEKLLAELRGSTEGAQMLLSGRERRQVEQWMEIAESEVEGQNILAYELLCEKLGKERAKFILLCKADPDLETRKEALTSYSFEELGL